MPAKLNANQRHVFDAVVRLSTALGRGPALAELQRDVGGRTIGRDAIVSALRALRQRRLIAWEHGDYTTMRVTGNPDEASVAGVDGARDALHAAGAAIGRALDALATRGT